MTANGTAAKRRLDGSKDMSQTMKRSKIYGDNEQDQTQYEDIFKALISSDLIRSQEIPHEISAIFSEYALGRFERCQGCGMSFSLMFQHERPNDMTEGVESKGSDIASQRWERTDDGFYCSTCMLKVETVRCWHESLGCDSIAGRVYMPLQTLPTCHGEYIWGCDDNTDIGATLPHGAFICQHSDCSHVRCIECAEISHCCDCGAYICPEHVGLSDDRLEAYECLCIECYDETDSSKYYPKCEECNETILVLNAELDTERVEKCFHETCNTWVCSECVGGASMFRDGVVCKAHRSK